jgi:hypothetical protein
MVYRVQHAHNNYFNRGWWSMARVDETPEILAAMDPIAHRQMAEAALMFMAETADMPDDITPLETAQMLIGIQGKFFEKMDAIMNAFFIQFNVGRGG